MWGLTRRGGGYTLNVMLFEQAPQEIWRTENVH